MGELLEHTLPWLETEVETRSEVGFALDNVVVIDSVVVVAVLVVVVFVFIPAVVVMPVVSSLFVSVILCPVLVVGDGDAMFVVEEDAAEVVVEEVI